MSLPSDAVDALRATFRGDVILPGDPGYDDARAMWNGFFDRKPAIICQCVGNHDVIQAVNFAREHQLLTSIFGGGHNSAGNAVCDDGLVIDLSRMRRCWVDPEGQTARVDGGALLADVDHETQLFGLAVPAGIVSHTGVGGLTLGGGFGWLSRKFGFTIDNLIGAEVVTAEGKLVRANSEENPDLFWALKGGGGNFGVVTSFEYKLHHIGTEVFAGLIVKKFEDAKEYLTFHADYVRGMPDEMTVWMVTRHAPPLPFLPEDWHGKLVVIVPFCYCGGDIAEGERLVQPILDTCDNVGVFKGMMPYVAWQQTFDPLVSHGARNYWKSHHVTEFADGFIDVIIEYAQKMPSPECEIFVAHMEGAPSRIPDSATAFGNRSTPFLVNLHDRWQDPADDAKALKWVEDLHAAMAPYADGVYVNFITTEGADRVKEAYNEEGWKRLVAAKDAWDPTNMFRMNQNIQPSSAPPTK